MLSFKRKTITWLDKNTEFFLMNSENNFFKIINPALYKEWKMLKKNVYYYNCCVFNVNYLPLSKHKVCDWFTVN